ncbi:MAG: hypothetical protein IS860_06935 [Nitrosopumilus sp.]|nr:hypothetical protein [Nitrosopumilus sp.]
MITLWPIYQFTDEDFTKYPMIKDMFEILTITDFTNDRDGYRVYGPDLTPYWVNVSSEEVRIQNSMSSGDTEKLENWLRDKGTYYFEYKDQIFRITFWIT